MSKGKNSKYELLKVLGITFLIFAILTWIIPIGSYSGATYTEGTTSPVGLYGLFINPLYSFGIFAQYILVFLAIGGLYGVLNKTGAYSTLINGISKKFEKKKTLFLVITIVAFALLTSFVGAQVALFVFVPFFVAILMTLGFNKITSLAATAGAIIIGVMGSTYGTSVVYKSFLGLDANNGIVYKIVFLVIITALYTFFIVNNTKNKKVIEEKPIKKKKTAIVLEKNEVQTKKVEIPLYNEGKEEKNKKSIIPLVLILVLLAVLLFAGMFNWYYTFGIESFNDIYSSIMEFEIGGVAIFAKIFGNLPEIGYFGNYDLAAVLLIATVLIAWIYGSKLNDFIEAFLEGAKEMILPAVYVMFASIIFAVMVNTTGNISFTIVNFLSGLVKEFNVLVVSLIGFVSSYFYNDFPYLVNGIYGVLSSYEVVVYPLISIILNATYGLAMLILPVSIVLIAALKYLNVSYKEWFKYIWKFLLQAFVVIILFSLIVLAIIK